jgi:hypothetical protein
VSSVSRRSKTGPGHLTHGAALALPVDGQLVVITGLLGIEKNVAGVVGVGVAGALATKEGNPRSFGLDRGENQT